MNESTDFAALNAKAAGGDALAQLSLAHAAITGQSGAPSLEEGERLLDAACAQRHPEALLLKAALVARGIGRARSMDGAYELVREAAAYGSPFAAEQLRALGQGKLDKGPWLAQIHLEPVAESPPIFVVENFIPAHVCDWLVERASRKGMKPALIHKLDGRVGIESDRNNSISGFLKTEGDLVVQLVSRRIARATDTPLENHEPLSVFRYTRGQQYKPHFDFVEPGTPEATNYAEELSRVGMRMVTVLVYLNDGYEGGETWFPRLSWQFKGKKGDALIFWSVPVGAKPDRNSLHAGKPVINGEKWLLSQWIRQKPFPLG